MLSIHQLRPQFPIFFWSHQTNLISCLLLRSCFTLFTNQTHRCEPYFLPWHHHQVHNLSLCVSIIHANGWQSRKCVAHKRPKPKNQFQISSNSKSEKMTPSKIDKKTCFSIRPAQKFWIHRLFDCLFFLLRLTFCYWLSCADGKIWKICCSKKDLKDKTKLFTGKWSSRFSFLFFISFSIFLACQPPGESSIR